MNFLPKDYQAPKPSTGYMKLQEGENKIRILTQAILGWEDWDNQKPIRFRFENKPAKAIDSKRQVRHFWAFVVWNYAEEQIQILNITQATIRAKIESLCNDEDWGMPYFYDIKIIKKGEGMDTEYDINPLPHKELNPSIIQAFNEKPCNLEALFTGEDPFDKSQKTFTQGIFKKDEKPKTVSLEDVSRLDKMLSSCSEEYKDSIWSRLSKFNVNSFEQLTPNLYVRVEAEINKHLTELKNQKIYQEALI